MQKENPPPPTSDCRQSGSAFLPSLCSLRAPFVAGFIALSARKVPGKVLLQLHPRYLMKQRSRFYELLYVYLFSLPPFISFLFYLIGRCQNKIA